MQPTKQAAQLMMGSVDALTGLTELNLGIVQWFQLRLVTGSRWLLKHSLQTDSGLRSREITDNQDEIRISKIARGSQIWG